MLQQRMRHLIIAFLLLSACGKKDAPAPEKTYPMTATIVSREARGNTLNLDNDDVPGVMAPMKMDYQVRGVKVDTLPPNGTRVNVTLHERDGEYWVTDIRSK